MNPTSEAFSSSSLRRPRLTVSEFADREIVVTTGPLSGTHWRTDFAPYQRGILDVFSEPGIEFLILKCSSQVGKTASCIIFVSYHMVHDPCPILVVEPTVKPMAEDFGRNRLNTIIEASPALREVVSPAKSKDSSNTILSKSFRGGFLAIGGANSAASLASRSVRLLLLDEIDRYPLELKGEGATIQVALRRTMTYRGRRRVVMASTPTLEGAPIDAWYERGDQRRFHVPCPECKVRFAYTWKQVRWVDDDPTTARMHCPACDYGLDDADRVAVLGGGEWVADKPDRREKNIASFHLWEAYSPLSSLAEIVTQFRAARDAQKRGDQSEMHTWQNTVLGEAVPEDAGEGLESTEVLIRRETFAAEVPAGAVFLTLGIDTQDDRLEILVTGWGPGEEMWFVDHQIIFGDTSQPHAWEELAAFLDREYKHESGRTLTFGSASIDSAGHRTSEVYAFVRKYGFRKVYAIIGRDGDRPVLSLPSNAKRVKNTPKMLLFTVGVDAAKALIYGRLKLTEPGPGYIHLPNADWCDVEFGEQLCSERLVTRFSKGRPVKVWVNIRPRNEVLDMSVYALHALRTAHPNLTELADLMELPVDSPPPNRTAPRRNGDPWIAKKPRGWMSR